MKKNSLFWQVNLECVWGARVAWDFYIGEDNVTLLIQDLGILSSMTSKFYCFIFLNRYCFKKFSISINYVSDNTIL